MSKKFTVTGHESMNLHKRSDADLLLRSKQKGPGAINFDVTLIKFSTRKALEEFNKKAGLRPVVYTQVPRNMAVYAHESDSDAREASVCK
jgi:hypothetical protein